MNYLLGTEALEISMADIFYLALGLGALGALAIYARALGRI
ncbi:MULTISPECIES: hypothetical protein [Mesorhizobium]|nr:MULTISPECIES: hypothetical protein [Mesorhizobium]